MAADDEDLELPTGDGGIGLAAEMRMGEFLLRYWQVLAGIVVAGIMAVAIYGWYTSATVAAQRGLSERIARAEHRLGAGGILQLSQTAVMSSDSTFDEAKARGVADQLVEVGRTGEGLGAAEAWLKAAEIYRILGDAEQRRSALEGAIAAGDGVLDYAAGTALASLDLEEGDHDAAIQRLTELSGTGPDFLRQQATLDLATAYETLGRWDDAASAYDTYLSTWPTAADVDDVAARRDKASEQAG